MKIAECHYSKYLLSVHFDDNLRFETMHDKQERCQNFLTRLGDLALENGHRLHGTYSIADGLLGLHAHFGVSWIPLHNHVNKTAKNQRQRIDRDIVQDLFEECLFSVDNPSEAIKRVTHDKPYVTDYIICQPKDGQSTILSGFYIHPYFVPTCSELKIHSYLVKQQFAPIENKMKNSHNYRLSSIVLISVAWYILISALLLSLFTNFPS